MARKKFFKLGNGALKRCNGALRKYNSALRKYFSRLESAKSAFISAPPMLGSFILPRQGGRGARWVEDFLSGFSLSVRFYTAFLSGVSIWRLYPAFKSYGGVLESARQKARGRSAAHVARKFYEGADAPPSARLISRLWDLRNRILLWTPTYRPLSRACARL